MKTSELRAKTVIELTAAVAALRKEQFNLRMQKNLSEAGSSVRPHNHQQIRRDIARVKTILNEKIKSSS